MEILQILGKMPCMQANVVPSTKPERPEWLRPKHVPQFFGIGRTLLYELIAANKIKTVSMRRPGQKHGTRLISYDSLSAYLESLAK